MIPGGFCYRIGGDEFCVICRTTNEQHLNDTLSLFHRRIDEMRKRLNENNKFPMVSTGYSVFFGLEKEYAAAMKKADEQMYIFKNKRKHGRKQ